MGAGQWHVYGIGPRLKESYDNRKTTGITNYRGEVILYGERELSGVLEKEHYKPGLQGCCRGG